MLKMMRDKAAKLEDELTQTEPASTSSTSPIYDAIVAKLSMLKPTELLVSNDSAKHAGHAAMKGIEGTETHFSVKIVAACFEGLSLVQRHKMVYTLLQSEIKNGVHALSLNTKTPEEA
jgi:BolA protein